MAHFMIISCFVLSLVPFTLLIFTLFWQLIFLPNCQIASKSSSTLDHFRPLACAPKAAWMWNLHPPKFPSSLSFLRKSIGELLVSSMSHACFRMGCVPIFILEGLTALIIMEICFSKFARSSKCLVAWMCTKRKCHVHTFSGMLGKVGRFNIKNWSMQTSQGVAWSAQHGYHLRHSDCPPELAGCKQTWTIGQQFYTSLRSSMDCHFSSWIAPNRRFWSCSALRWFWNRTWTTIYSKRPNHWVRHSFVWVMIFSDSHQTLWRLVRLDTSCCCCKLCFSRWRLSICLEPCSRAILSLKTTLCLCGYVMKDPTVCFDNYSSCIQINQDRLVAQLQSVEVIQFLKLHFAWPRMMLLQLLDLLLLQQRLCVDSFFRQGILCETGASQFF